MSNSWQAVDNAFLSSGSSRTDAALSKFTEVTCTGAEPTAIGAASAAAAAGAGIGATATTALNDDDDDDDNDDDDGPVFPSPGFFADVIVMTAAAVFLSFSELLEMRGVVDEKEERGAIDWPAATTRSFRRCSSPGPPCQIMLVLKMSEEKSPEGAGPDEEEDL